MCYTESRVVKSILMTSIHGFPVLICSRKATWIGMSCTVWVWKSSSDEGNMEEKQREYKWKTESGNKVGKKPNPTSTLIINTVSNCKNTFTTPWIHFTGRNSDGSALQHIDVYVHKHVTGMCILHTEAHTGGHKVKKSHNLSLETVRVGNKWH